MMKVLASFLVGVLVMALPAFAQQGPLRIEITEGVIEPLPYAVPDFVPDSPAAKRLVLIWRG
jgi:TolB protein